MSGVGLSSNKISKSFTKTWHQFSVVQFSHLSSAKNCFEGWKIWIFCFWSCVIVKLLSGVEIILPLKKSFCRIWIKKLHSRELLSRFGRWNTNFGHFQPHFRLCGYFAQGFDDSTTPDMKNSDYFTPKNRFLHNLDEKTALERMRVSFRLLET